MACILNVFKKKKKGFQERDLKCPRCNIVMDKVRKEGVVIDNCPSCNGLWLDDNEIEKLVQIASKQAKQKTQKNSAKASASVKKGASKSSSKKSSKKGGKNGKSTSSRKSE